MEVVNGSRLRQVAVVPGEELPMLLIAQLADPGLVVYYDEAMPAGMEQALSVHAPEIDFPQLGPLLQVLKSQDIDPQVGHYKTYMFPSQPDVQNDVICIAKNDPAIRAFGFDGFAEHVYAIQKNDAVVSACVSARENAECGEAWVYTSPDHRHQGLAQKVVNAWAGSLIDAGKIPLYSHKIENSASANLAARLGLQPVFEEITLSSQV